MSTRPPIILSKKRIKTQVNHSDIVIHQSLEFVAETRILAEMKIEIKEKNFFPQKNKLTSILFF